MCCVSASTCLMNFVSGDLWVANVRLLQHLNCFGSIKNDLFSFVNCIRYIQVPFLRVRFLRGSQRTAANSSYCVLPRLTAGHKDRICRNLPSGHSPHKGEARPHRPPLPRPTPRLSVAQIANALNFTTSNYFTRYCIKHLGMSPTEYRATH